MSAAELPIGSGRVLCCRKASSSLGAPGMLSSGAVFAAAGESFLRRPGWQEFRRVLAGLREHCPAAKPVVVRTSWLPPDILGECIRRPRRFVIRLNNCLRSDQAVETLLHEWAHALAWNFTLDKLSKQPGLDPAEFDHASHDEAWGCAYSRVWRAYSGLAGGGGRSGRG